MGRFERNVLRIMLGEDQVVEHHFDTPEQADAWKQGFEDGREKYTGSRTWDDATLEETYNLGVNAGQSMAQFLITA